jgi:hypothetical protein
MKLPCCNAHRQPTRDLRSTHDNEKPEFRTAANRAATARSGNDLSNFKRFFNGAKRTRLRAAKQVSTPADIRARPLTPWPSCAYSFRSGRDKRQWLL